MKPDRKIVVCNYANGTNIARQNALCYVLHGWSGGGWERVFVAARSRGGRIVKKWEAAKKLKNARIKTIVEQNPFYEYGRSESDCSAIVGALKSWFSRAI